MPVTRLSPNGPSTIRLAVALSLAAALLPPARAADAGAGAGAGAASWGAHPPAGFAERNARLQQLMKLPPDVRADCMAAGFGMMSLPLAYMKFATPDLLGQAADALHDAGRKVHLARLRDDYDIMAAQVRLHGGDDLKKDARMNAALADFDAWQKSTCPQAPPKAGATQAAR